MKTDTAAEYTLVTKRPSPFPQHKGHPLQFGSVVVGKVYVSYHLMPIYMSPPLQKMVTPALQKRMQGKSCFNFKTELEPELLNNLSSLTEAAWKQWRDQHWT